MNTIFPKSVCTCTCLPRGVLLTGLTEMDGKACIPDLSFQRAREVNDSSCQQEKLEAALEFGTTSVGDLLVIAGDGSG